jgi:hypothetical protein
MVTYQSTSHNIKTVYTVEYIDNQNDADYVSSGRIDKGEPWERYKTKVFQSADSAFSLYVLMLVREDIYDVQLFEQLYLNDEVVREQYIEPVNTLQWSIRMAVSKEMEKRIESLGEANEMLSGEVAQYESFVKKYNAQKTFKEFKERQEEAS